MYKMCVLNNSKIYFNKCDCILSGQNQSGCFLYSLYTTSRSILNTCLNSYLFPFLYFNLLSSLEDEYFNLNISESNYTNNFFMTYLLFSDLCVLSKSWEIVECFQHTCLKMREITAVDISSVFEDYHSRCMEKLRQTLHLG